MSENPHHAEMAHARPITSDDKGFSFSKASKGISFHIPDGPGPLYYDTVEADKFLHNMKAENAKGDILLHGPKTRFIENFIKQNEKDVGLCLDRVY